MVPPVRIGSLCRFLLPCTDSLVPEASSFLTIILKLISFPILLPCTDYYIGTIKKRRAPKSPHTRCQLSSSPGSAPDSKFSLHHLVGGRVIDVVWSPLWTIALTVMFVDRWWSWQQNTVFGCPWWGRTAHSLKHLWRRKCCDTASDGRCHIPLCRFEIHSSTLRLI